LASSYRHAAELLVAVLCAIAAIPARLAAQYVDPGSASILWQLLLAGVFGVVFSFRRYLLSLSRSLLRRFRRSSDE